MDGRFTDTLNFFKLTNEHMASMCLFRKTVKKRQTEHE